MSSPTPLRFAVLTVSDRCSRGETEDRSGPAVRQWIEKNLGGQCVAAELVPDGVDSVRSAVTGWLERDEPPHFVATTGGTGFAPRDHTPEGVAPLIDRPAPQLLDLARLRCLAKTPLAYASRGVAGVAGSTLVITLPGSPRGAVEVLDALGEVLPHSLRLLRGLPGLQNTTPAPTAAS
ncbi:MAG: MogA/MoaB family molybdenum cofactor biosynthesis protein [Planctomycetota bacterium]